jgi:hypothetical protein
MTRHLLLFCALFCLATFSNAQQLIDSQFKGSRTLAQMQASYGLLMENGIRMYKIRYTTLDVHGVPDTASGLVVIPVRNQTYAYPLICVQHGTVDSKTDVPSNLQGGWQLAAVFAGQGYVASAADFLGLGDSRGFHPYVHAASEASASIDMLFAVREFAQQEDIALNDQLFITGYSQGGHAAAAVHREIQENFSDDFTVTASAPLSGPYSISGEMKRVILADEAYFFPAYLPNTALSYNEVYGLYESIDQFFKEPYASAIQQFRDGQISLFNLNTTLIDLLTQNTGASVTRHMLQDSIVEILRNEPEHPINIALADNDVYDWAPEAPTRLFYCMADDQVAFRNSVVADSVMNLNGAPDIDAIDLNPNYDHGQCVEPALIATSIFFSTFKELVLDSPEQEIAADSWTAFPNPAGDWLYLKESPLEGTLQLFDLNGRVVLSQVIRGTNEPVHVAHLPEGVYIAQFLSNGFSRTGRVVIQR